MSSGRVHVLGPNPPGDQPVQPRRVGGRQRLSGPVELAPVGVDRTDDDVHRQLKTWLAEVGQPVTLGWRSPMSSAAPEPTDA
jgi:hypothetical protein